MLTDTHCHLNFDGFHPDRDAVVERARRAGVERILNPGIDLASSRAALKAAHTYSEVYAAVGIHPNDTRGWQDAWLDELRELAGDPKTVAIGEIGLDDYWDDSPFEVQMHAFQSQLDLAAELSLPVVVHCRDKTPPGGLAIEAVLLTLSTWQKRLELEGSVLANRPGVLHSFNGDLSAAQRAVQVNFLVGITGPVTFKKADELRRVAMQLPVEALLIETDAPFLTPHPLRGKRNEPAYVRYVAEKIAEIRHLEFEETARITSANAERIFRWEGNHLLR